MKKISFLFLLTLLSAGIVKAQYIAGGSISFSSNGGTVDNGTTTTDQNSRTSFYFNPKAGYFLSDDFLVGVELNLGTNKTTNPGVNERIITSNSFGITPFARYYAIRMDRFAIYGQGQLNVSFGHTKDKTGGTINAEPKTTSFGINIYPGISYDLNDKIQLEAGINLLSLGLNWNSSKDDTSGTEVKTSTHNLQLRG